MRMKCLYTRRLTDSHGVIYLATTIGVPDGAWGGGGEGVLQPPPLKKEIQSDIMEIQGNWFN